MPPKKARKPKKPVQQKQKQKQSQRVVVNVNQARPAKRARPRPRQVQQPQQVSYQPIITMTGSVPVPQPYYNPIQSTAGFPSTPPPPSLGTPVSLSAPVEVPVFADESVKVIGDEPMTAPIPKSEPQKPIDIIVPIKPFIPDETIVVKPKPRPALPPSIISTKPPLTIEDKSDSSSGKFLLPPPPARNEMKQIVDSAEVARKQAFDKEVAEGSRVSGLSPELVSRALTNRAKRLEKEANEAKAPPKAQEKKKLEEKKPEEKKPEEKKPLPFVPEPLVFERDSGRVEELGRYDAPDFRPIPKTTRAGFNIPADNSLLSLIDPNQLESNSIYPSISSGSSSLAGTIASFPESDLTQYSDKIRKRAEAFGIQDRRQQKLTDAYNKRLDDKRFENEKIIAERLAEPQREEYQFGNDLSLSTHSMGTTSSGVSDTSGIIPLQSDGSMSYSRLYPKGSDLSSDSDSAFEAVRDAERKNREIARRYKPEGGFNIPSNKSLSRTSIIVGDAPPIVPSVSSGSSGKTKSNPYDPFAQSDSSVGGKTEPSLNVIKPLKKRVVATSDSELSDTGANIIPQERLRKKPTPAPVKLEPIKEKKSTYVSKEELQSIAKGQGIKLKRDTGKDKTMNELRIEINELR